MQYGKIENGIVVNVIVADEEFAKEHGFVLIPQNAGIGWTYSNGVFEAPPQPIPELPVPLGETSSSSLND